MAKRKKSSARRKGRMPPALAAYWAKRRPKKRTGRRRGKGKTTITESRTVKRVRTNPGLSVLYAVKGGHRLKFLGGIKFAKKGRPKLFRSSEAATTVGNTLYRAFPALRGFKMVVARA